MLEQFEQLQKNTVEAKNQLSDSEHVFFSHVADPGLRILLVGNSITLHGIKIDIGWDRCCGMAASCVEKDYVHILMKQIRTLHPSTSFCICQAAEWERQYKTGSETLSLYKDAQSFKSDIIVIRIVENCPSKDFDPALFKENLKKLLLYLDLSSQARVILTTAFWHHPGDVMIEELAQEEGYPLVTLGDLGELDEMKAIGKFDHSGVANHPGDLGMETIAERIYAAMTTCIESICT